MLLDREFQERETDILGAFSEEAFALAAYSDRAKVAIEEIQFGLNNNDLAIMIGGGSNTPFQRGGLVIARASTITAEPAKVKLGSAPSREQVWKKVEISLVAVT